MSNIILPKYVPLTPKEMYQQMVNSTYDGVRQVALGYSYIPAQFGGIFGQIYIQQQSLVMELTGFQVQ